MENLVELLFLILCARGMAVWVRNNHERKPFRVFLAWGACLLPAVASIGFILLFPHAITISGHGNAYLWIFIPLAGMAAFIGAPFGLRAPIEKTTAYTQHDEVETSDYRYDDEMPGLACDAPENDAPPGGSIANGGIYGNDAIANGGAYSHGGPYGGGTF